jgi:hypothetical protein
MDLKLKRLPLEQEVAEQPVQLKRYCTKGVHTKESQERSLA